MNTIFNRGLDQLSDWTTGTFVWLLAKPDYTADAAHEFIDDVTDEVGVASYTRIAVTGASRDPDDTNDILVYSCDDPDFGDLEDTEDARWLILARDVTTDADSPVIMALDMGLYGIQLGDDFIVYLHPQGFFTARQVPA